jgi:hypothetical protein
MMLQLNEMQIKDLLSVIEEVHGQYGDDVCWMDFDRIFIAAGMSVPKRGVGDKGEMMLNCARFIEKSCRGGDWPSYRELEGVVRNIASYSVKTAFDYSMIVDKARQLIARLDDGKEKESNV